MIIDIPLIANLAQGADRVIIEPGDGQIVVPPTFFPAIEFMLAHGVSNNILDRCTTSKLCEFAATKLNVAAIAENVIVLPKGLYSLEWDIGMRSNFQPTPLNEGIGFALIYQSFTITLCKWLAHSGTQMMGGARRFLLTSDATLALEFDATNAVATNSYSAHLGLNVIRHL